MGEILQFVSKTVKDDSFFNEISVNSEIFMKNEQETGLFGVNSLGMNMDPPKVGGKKVVLEEVVIGGKLLVTKNTGREFRVDDWAFEIAKHISWYEWKGSITTNTKVCFEQYVGIVGVRDVDRAPEWDYRSEHYRQD